jgi:hypothetical protein
MTTYYKKVNLNIGQDLDLDKLKGQPLFDYGRTAWFFQIAELIYLNNIFEPVFKIPPTNTYLIQATAQLRPHRDDHNLTSMNYYIKPQGLVTNFWQPKENARRIKQIKYNSYNSEYETVELGYVRDDLILVDTFTATENEVYLLDTREIHSVDGSLHNAKRTILQFQWDIPMDDLIEKLGF